MLTPTLKKIKEINPSLKLGIVLRKELGLRGLAENVGFIDDVYEISLKVHPRTYVPWLFWTYEYWMIRRKTKEVLKKTRKYARVKFIYTQLLPTITYIMFRSKTFKKHKIERFASELSIILDKNDRNKTYLNVPQEVLQEVRKRLFDHMGRICAKVIGIQRNTMDKSKFIPLKETQSFIDRLNEKETDFFFIVFADLYSYRLEEEIDGRHLAASNLKYSWEIIGDGDALSLAALVELCEYVVSIDSAVFNMAVALEKNTVGVFNTYKVRPYMVSLKKNNILCIDKSDVTAEDLITQLNRLSMRQAVEN
jgi:ADP-heptose:LPS heptosyltransferase